MGERQNGTWTSVNTTSSATSQVVDGTNMLGALNGDSFVNGVNFAQFENVEADGTETSFLTDKGATVHHDGFDADYRLHLNGLQIEQVPEPSTALLGGLGMLALLRRRRS